MDRQLEDRRDLSVALIWICLALACGIGVNLISLAVRQ